MAADSEQRERPRWAVVEGSLSLGAIPWVAYVISKAHFLAMFPVMGDLHNMTQDPAWFIVAASMLALPVTALIYGGVLMVYSAKDVARELVERFFTERGRRQGRRQGLMEGREEMRDEIRKLVIQHNIQLTPEEAARFDLTDTAGHNGNGDSPSS